MSTHNNNLSSPFCWSMCSIYLSEHVELGIDYRAINVTLQNVERWLKELRDHKDTNTVIMLVGNKAYLCHLRAMLVGKEVKDFAETENTIFMETSALEAVNVEYAFTKVLTQIYRVVSKKALEARNEPTTALPKGQVINVGSRDDFSAVKKWGCCST